MNNRNGRNGIISDLWSVLANTYNPSRIEAVIRKTEDYLADLENSTAVRPYEMVREFHERFGHKVGPSPAPLSAAERLVRAGFLREELQEFVDADDLVDQVDAMIDLLYIAYGNLVMMGVEPTRVFEAVHAANMNKLWPDGRPRWREDNGKVIKPLNWVGPEAEIEQELARQRDKAG